MKIAVKVLAILFLLSMATFAEAQTTSSTQRLVRGTATDVLDAEIKDAVRKGASSAISDQQLKVVSINGEYNVGVGVVRRAKTAGRNPGGGIEHSQITEVYHVIEGNGTSDSFPRVEISSTFLS